MSPQSTRLLLGLGGAAMVAAVLAMVGVWWTSGGGSAGLGLGGGGSETEVKPGQGGSAGSGDAFDLEAIARQLRRRTEQREEAVDWLTGSLHRGVEVACTGLDDATAGAVSEALPARRVGDELRIYRRDFTGRQVIRRGNVQGVLIWSADGCSFEPLQAQLARGVVVFSDGEPAVDAMVEVCGQVLRTDDGGRFETEVLPDRQAVVTEAGGIHCVVRAQHRDGFTATSAALPLDEPLRVVLEHPVDPADIETMSEQAAMVADQLDNARSSDVTFLDSVIAEGPPPGVRAYLEERREALSDPSEARAEIERVLDDIDRIEADLLDGLDGG